MVRDELSRLPTSQGEPTALLEASTSPSHRGFELQLDFPGGDTLASSSLEAAEEEGIWINKYEIR